MLRRNANQWWVGGARLENVLECPAAEWVSGGSAMHKMQGPNPLSQPWCMRLYGTGTDTAASPRAEDSGGFVSTELSREVCQRL